MVSQGRADAGPARLSPYRLPARESVRASVVAFACYLLLALALTYPLALRLDTHIPGGNVDEGAFLWNVWWMKYALLDVHTNPLSTSMIFYPLGANLALYTLTPLQGVLALPLTLAAGPIVASNVLFILAFALSGLGAYLLALDVLLTNDAHTSASTRCGAAFVAGVLFAFVSGRFLYAALGQYDYVHVQWLPLTVLFLLRTARQPGWRAPVLAGLFAACAGLTEMNFVVFLAIFVVIWLVYVMWLPVVCGSRLAYAMGRRRTLKPACSLRQQADRPALARLGLALAVFLVGFGPLGLAVVRETLLVGDYMVRGWGGADRFLVDVLGPLVPSPLHPLVGLWARDAARSFSDINFGFAGYMALLLGVLGAAASGAARTLLGKRFWLAVTLVFFVLALGPLLHANGQSQWDVDGLPINVPLPYIIFHYLPILKGARVPGRFAIMATMALSALVALGALWLLRRVRWPKALAALLAAVIVVENLAAPLPLVKASAPEPYQRIAADRGDFAVLQIPLGWRDGFGTVGRERTLLQAYQSVHGKRIIGGNTSRSPDYVLSYFANLPVLSSIVALEEGRALAPGALEADRSLAGAVLSFLDVRYVVVHGDYTGGPVEQYIQAALPVTMLAQGTGVVENAFWRFNETGKWVETATESAAWTLYAVQGAGATAATHIDVGSPTAQMNLVAGWSRAEVGDATFSWIEARHALLLVRRAGDAQAVFSLRASPFSYPGAPVQQMTVAVNERVIGTLAMQDGWQEYRLVIPAGSLQRGINQITLALAHVASPAQVLGSDDQRTLGAAVDWVRLE